MKKLAVLVAMLLVVAPATLDAQGAQKGKAVDVTGVWESTIEAPQGTLVSTATYKQDGEVLTGTHVGQAGEFALKGTVKGNVITYQITVDLGGQSLTITYSGKVDGDSISGTADFGGMGSGTWTVKRKK